MIEVLRPGLLTTVQDAGRQGQRHLGVSQCGALDELALTLGNLLVGNATAAAALEITLGTPVALRFHTLAVIALTGATADANLDGKPVWPGWRITIRPGQTLTLQASRRGMRSYLCVAGGLQVPAVLGACATDLSSGFGGMQGRALRQCDLVPIRDRDEPLPPLGCRLPGYNNIIRALPGPEHQEFGQQAQKSFWSTAWQVLPQSNRMGYRLEGHTLPRDTDRELLSHAVFPGTIQVPPNGKPIVLLADCQTTGGYPRMACVIAADMWKLAQVRLGELVYFAACTRAEAKAARVKLQKYFQHMRTVLNAHRP